jgi:nitroimidazol reductase NimA-like FMN-containing flavoprotein (pyridoxamine 5'-phosphate oxidase superfamily)
MRQSDREITDNSELEAVLVASLVCHLAINDPAGAPYIVALCYGYDFNTISRELTLWFHCAKEGLKLDLLNQDHRVSFQMESRLSLVKGTGVQACDWGMDYESLVGQGTITKVEDRDEILHGLDCLLSHYGGSGLPYVEPTLSHTEILRLNVVSFTGKRSRRLWPQVV